MEWECIPAASPCKSFLQPADLVLRGFFSSQHYQLPGPLYHPRRSSRISGGADFWSNFCFRAFGAEVICFCMVAVVPPPHQAFPYNHGDSSQPETHQILTTFAHAVPIEEGYFFRFYLFVCMKVFLPSSLCFVYKDNQRSPSGIHEGSIRYKRLEL